MESEEESDDDSEYSEASEDSDSEGIAIRNYILLIVLLLFNLLNFLLVYFIRGRIRQL